MSTIVIAKDGDLLVEVIEWDYETKWPTKEPVIRDTQNFWVSRKVLKDNSRVFTDILDKKANQHQTAIKIVDNTIPAMEIWFQILHNVEANCSVPIHAMWHIAKAGERYEFDPKKITDWFAEWYERQPLDRWYEDAFCKEPKESPDPRCLLYPCWLFDHYEGFRRITEFVAYKYTRHIMEINPTRHRDIHLPQRIIRKTLPPQKFQLVVLMIVPEQLNAAKGRLRTVIHRDLYVPNDKLLKAECKCKAEALWRYERALTDCHAWPLEKVAQYTSMHEILERLLKFIYTPDSDACGSCRLGYGTSVNRARSHTAVYFTGLCLDCMNRSKTLTGDEDADYWSMGSLHEDDTIKGCRAGEHGQPTWWFSYMGQRQSKETFERMEKKARCDGDSGSE
ncbi:MAG: hypothetical protein Q9226_007517 [Calogaya cf. arnoldii]